MARNQHRLCQSMILSHIHILWVWLTGFTQFANFSPLKAHSLGMLSEICYTTPGHLSFSTSVARIYTPCNSIHRHLCWEDPSGITGSGKGCVAGNFSLSTHELHIGIAICLQ